jgi:WD40 repeat protein
LLYSEKELKAPDEQHFAFALAGDGKTVAISTQGTVELRDLANGETRVFNIATPTTGLYIRDVTLSPDGKLLAVAIGRSIRDFHQVRIKLYDVTSQKELGTFGQSGSSVSPFAFSPDSKRLIVGLDDDIKLFDVSPLRETSNFKTPKSAGYALSPDGKMLAASTSDHDRFIIELWELASGQEVGELTGKGEIVKAIAFSPKGDMLATGGGDKKVLVWNIKSRQLINEYTFYAGSITALSYSPDGSKLAIGYEDGTIQLCNPTDQTEYARLKRDEGSIYFLAFTPDSKILFSFGGGGDPNVRSWDVAARSHEQMPYDGFPLDTKAVKFSPDGKVIAIEREDQKVTLLDANTNKELYTLSDSEVYSIAFSPDGKLLAVGGHKKASLWDVASGTARGEPFKYESNVLLVAFSPDGKLLATSFDNGLVSVWDIASRKVIASLNNKQVDGINFSSDGKMLALPQQHSVEVWDSALSKQLWMTSFKGERFVRASAFSPASNVLAVASDENSVKLFDAASGTVLATLKGHRWGVRSLAYSQDGTRLATGGGDGTVKIWDMTSFRELLTLRPRGHVEPIYSVAFSPDGRRLATLRYSGGVKMWITATDTEVAAETQTPGSSH